jgi:hypothetical protein
MVDADDVELTVDPMLQLDHAAKADREVRADQPEPAAVPARPTVCTDDTSNGPPDVSNRRSASTSSPLASESISMHAF